MDKKFLEFWGNVLLTAAKGQQQLEELAPWLKGLGTDSHDWTRLFSKIYGLDTTGTGSKPREKAMQQFQRSLKEWMALFDMVPRSELAAAQNKYQELQQQLAEQQATIEQLQQLLDEKGIPSTKAVLDFSNLIQKQSEQFQTLMGNLGIVFKPDKDNSTSE